LPDSVKHNPKLIIVLLFQLFQFSGEILVCCEDLSESDKRPHDLNVDLDCLFAVENAGEHGHALLGEDVRQILGMRTPS